jgi:hypothetical protein
MQTTQSYTPYKYRWLLLLLLPLLCCRSDQHSTSNTTAEKFDKVKWLVKTDKEYPYRDAMLHDLVYNQTLKGLHYDSVLHMLGHPDREDNGHLFYHISAERISGLPVVLHARTLVLKLRADSTVEWRKIKE